MTSLFSLARTIQVLGNGQVLHGVDYIIVRDWCERSHDDTVTIFSILKEMAHEANKRS